MAWQNPAKRGRIRQNRAESGRTRQDRAELGRIRQPRTAQRAARDGAGGPVQPGAHGVGTAGRTGSDMIPSEMRAATGPPRPPGLEPGTCGLEDRCSIRLSYGRNATACILRVGRNADKLHTGAAASPRTRVGPAGYFTPVGVRRDSPSIVSSTGGMMCRGTSPTATSFGSNCAMYSSMLWSSRSMKPKPGSLV